ncbi:PhnD/SsuA/transferrin family substrate-binding protein [Pigmentiphaga litoralis]|uniref:Sulfonate transport system substrate-binding protein n=1 Tax=Pigmentiphaga litoralis TaxID=516702 RepID=A0A7Y9ISW1_9BURK|nr:PhnD/SsuA/transferrin family substrate-binding protein [Pigmentiphaga litoralis]NYE23926.1 sulfonate transport system substrate-binding protein [Pigmentiphaga litoralis]NYE82460.1 sulfonate transport system substrate-binding protein [Pigmentiphaga litoralis]
MTYAHGMLGLLLGASVLGAAHAQTGSNFTTPVPANTQLVVADQRQQLQVAFAASGEEKKLPFKVKFADFRGGPAILEAFRAGSLDVAIVGDAPPIQAHVSGNPLPIVAARQFTAVTYQYAVRPGLSLTSLNDIRGKKIAYAEGTATQSFVLATLSKIGLTKKDVTLVPLRIVDFLDAVRSGAVDVAPLNEPPFSRYVTHFKKDGASALPEQEVAGLPQGLSYIYASPTALKDPVRSAAIATFIAQWVKSSQWTEENEQAWVQAYYVKSQNLPAEVGRQVHQSLGKSTFPRLSDLIPRQQNTINLIHAAGDIPKKLDAREEFDLRFNDTAASAARAAL